MSGAGSVISTCGFVSMPGSMSLRCAAPEGGLFMGSFKTDEGHIHVGRVAFVGYLIFIVACVTGRVGGRISGGLVTFAMSWWIAFCGKRPPLMWSEYSKSFRMRFGIGLFVTSLAQGISGLWVLYHSGH
jgi:hypothetical protein